MKTIVRILVTTIVLVAVALFAVTFIDINRYKPEIQTLVKGATGRDVDLNGQLRIAYSIMPTVIVEDVRFGNSAWSSSPTMFEAERVAVRFSLFSLFAGSVDVRKVEVRRASLLLERNADGNTNWELGPSVSGESTDSAFATRDLPTVVIQDLSVKYVSGRRDAISEVHFDRADIEPRKDGVSIGIEGTLNGRSSAVSGYIAGDADAFSVSDLKISYEAMSLTGRLTASRSSQNAPLQIDGNLEAERLNLDQLLDEGESAPTTSLFSDTPLPFQFLDLAEGEVEVSVSSLLYHAFDLKDVHAGLSLKDGKLVMPVFAEYEGRRLEAEATARNGNLPSVHLVFNAPDFNLGEFLKQTDVTDLVEVRGHVGVDVHGRGKSIKAIMASLNGKVDIATGRGQIHSRAFELIAEDLLWALVPKGGDKGIAKLTCFINELNFSAGVGEVAALALVTERIRTSGSGSINLATETIDMTLKPRPNDPGLLSLATPVNIRGSLSSPSIRPDTTSVLGDVALSVGAGLLTGGVGAILPLISAESFDAESASACLRVISESGSSPSDGEQGVLDAAGEGAGKVLKGVGDILTSPFD